MICCAASSPTPLIAPNPKRMRPLTGVNVSRDSFTSGPSTVMPIAPASATKCETLSALPSSAVRTAAIKATGWLALR